MNQATTLYNQGKLSEAEEAYEGYQRAIDLYNQLISTRRTTRTKIQPCSLHCESSKYTR